jgi:hypothetical protein
VHSACNPVYKALVAGKVGRVRQDQVQEQAFSHPDAFGLPEVFQP